MDLPQSNMASEDAYSGFTIAVPRNHRSQVPFSSRKRHPSLHYKGHVNCGPALGCGAERSGLDGGFGLNRRFGCSHNRYLGGGLNLSLGWSCGRKRGGGSGAGGILRHQLLDDG